MGGTLVTHWHLQGNVALLGRRAALWGLMGMCAAPRINEFSRATAHQGQKIQHFCGLQLLSHCIDGL